MLKTGRKPDSNEDWFEKLFKWAFPTLLILSVLSTIAGFIFLFIFGDKAFSILDELIG